MKRRRRASNMGAIDQINMTPLIDLTFLLLIVFMITMPLVEYSMPVETPQMNASPMPEKTAKPSSCRKTAKSILIKMKCQQLK